ncbi:hypothetical protein RN001_005677 [Aquatica leii]|uniref:EB domain-containing protein n=1 Tax=Aquatica leii TaxID=1421715 RepID=A0AAN7SPX7_9COLE|nr:hypothetical protein RN001_005677 [Aquatica leii]
MYSTSITIFILFNLQLFVFAYQISLRNNFEEIVQVPCENDYHCSEFGFEAKCLENICQCSNKQNCGNTNIKTYVSKIGKYCNLSSKCYVDYSHCNRGKCECMNGTVASNDKRRCLKTNAELGLPCQESSQCLRMNASCIDGNCTCPLKMHSSNGICYKSVAIEQVCHRNEECAHIDFTECSNKKCTCNTDYVYNKKRLRCLLKAHNISSRCFENIQCSSTLGFGSECHQGVCKCKEVYNYKTSINKCVLDILLGNECENHNDCHQIGSDEDRLECLLGICKCKQPYIEHYGYCVKNSGWTWTSFTLPDVLPYMFTYAFFYVIR